MARYNIETNTVTNCHHWLHWHHVDNHLCSLWCSYLWQVCHHDNILLSLIDPLWGSHGITEFDQHWFRQWLGAVRQQVIAWTIVDITLRFFGIQWSLMPAILNANPMEWDTDSTLISQWIWMDGSLFHTWWWRHKYIKYGWKLCI